MYLFDRFLFTELKQRDVVLYSLVWTWSTKKTSILVNTHVAKSHPKTVYRLNHFCSVIHIKFHRILYSIYFIHCWLSCCLLCVFLFVCLFCFVLAFPFKVKWKLRLHSFFYDFTLMFTLCLWCSERFQRHET